MKFKKTLEEQVLSPEVFYMKDTAKSPLIQNAVKYVSHSSSRIARVCLNAFAMEKCLKF